MTREVLRIQLLVERDDNRLALRLCCRFKRGGYGQVAVLFVSHASKDDALASALEAWLNANGFTDIFVDHHSIPGGGKWREALRAESGACRVVLCLITTNWLSSSECFGEFEAAWYMGKRIVPLFLLPPSEGACPVKAEQHGTEFCRRYWRHWRLGAAGLGCS
jgi:hypothetical protein